VEGSVQFLRDIHYPRYLPHPPIHDTWIVQLSAPFGNIDGHAHDNAGNQTGSRYLQCPSLTQHAQSGAVSLTARHQPIKILPSCFQLIDSRDTRPYCRIGRSRVNFLEATALVIVSHAVGDNELGRSKNALGASPGEGVDRDVVLLALGEQPEHGHRGR
jgi:hypothetical protein